MLTPLLTMRAQNWDSKRCPGSQRRPVSLLARSVSEGRRIPCLRFRLTKRVAIVFSHHQHAVDRISDKPVTIRCHSETKKLEVSSRFWEISAIDGVSSAGSPKTGAYTSERFPCTRVSAHGRAYWNVRILRPASIHTDCSKQVLQTSSSITVSSSGSLSRVARIALDLKHFRNGPGS